MGLKNHVNETREGSVKIALFPGSSALEREVVRTHEERLVFFLMFLILMAPKGEGVERP